MPSGPFTKYKFSFTSISGRHLTVSFNFKSWHIGAVTTITAGAYPFILSNQNSDDNILVGIRGTSAQITFIDDGTIPVTAFASDDDEEVQVILSDDDTTETIWEGYLVQDDCNEPFMPAPKQVTLTATDNLGLLKDLEFTDESGDRIYERVSITDYFAIILNKTGLHLTTNTFCNLFEAAMDNRTADPANDPLYQAKIDTRTFTKDADTFEDCYTVLNNILESWECQLFQHMGQWFIVRWTELRYFDNLIPGTQYASDLTLPTATTLPDTIAIGPTQDIKFTNANQVKSLVRPIKYDKLTFNYEQPYKLILNDDFKLVGSLISTSTSGNIRTDRYNVVDFTYVNPPASTFYIEVKTNTITGIELERYLVMPFNASFTSYVDPSIIEVNQNDRFECSLSFKAAADISDNIIFRFGFLLSGASGDHYTLTNISGHLHWNNIGSGTTANSLTQTVVPSDDSSQWTPMDVFSGTDETFIPPIPEDGNLQIELKGFNDPSASQPSEDTYIKDLKFTYYSYINSSTSVAGQFHKSEQPVKVIKKNIEKTLYVDDSPKNNIRGTMFLSDGTTKTALWEFPIVLTFDFQFDFSGGNNFLHIDGFPELYSLFSVGQSLTFSGTVSNNSTFSVIAKTSLVSNNFSLRLSPNVVNETVFDGHVSVNRQNQFGFFQKTDLMKLNYTYRTRIEGDILGIYDGGYMGMLTVFSLDDLANKFFILANPKFDFKSEVSSGIVQEIWDNTEGIYDSNFTNTFEYIYKTQ